MLTARKFFIFFVIFFAAGVIQIYAQQESNCYVAVSVEDHVKAASNGDEEIQGKAKNRHEIPKWYSKKLERHREGIRLQRYKGNDKGP